MVRRVKDHVSEGIYTNEVLASGDFVGEICITKQPVYLSSANTTTACGVIMVPRESMVRLAKTDRVISNALTAFLLHAVRHLAWQAQTAIREQS